jgi:transglutaminase-like putative cysteine protease
MRLRIRHETNYRLSHPARRTVQYLRLTPRQDRCQRVLSWSVSGPPSLIAWTDGFGNRAHVASELEAHDSVDILVEGEVETNDTWGVLPLDDGLPPPMFLRPTPLTEVNESIRALVLPFAARLSDDGVVPTLHRLTAAIADAVLYTPGITDVTSTAAHALAMGNGVCQDHAHLFIAACRVLGLPSRYVSGYLHSERSEMAGHAWAEAYVGGLGWVSFDPANRQSATDAYVRLAVGFDYAGAAPVVGCRTGGGGEALSVQLAVEQVQQ